MSAFAATHKLLALAKFVVLLPAVHAMVFRGYFSFLCSHLCFHDIDDRRWIDNKLILATADRWKDVCHCS